MATDLTGLKVKDTYNSLLKIGDNSSLSATPDRISDGLGNESALWLSTARVGIGSTPDSNYTLTVSNNIKTQSLDASSSITASSLRLTGGSGTQGLMSWNTDEETIDVVQNGAVLQLGQETHVHVKNQSGATISDGTPVYVTGTLGSSGRLTVAPMIADGSIEAKYFLGVTTEDIPNGEDGKVTTFGKIRGLNTSAYSEGQTLYVSASTAGFWQTTAPVAPNLDLEVAIVINVSANNGTIFVRAQQGHYLGMLHDVYISSPANNQFLVYNSTTSRWENQGIASVGSINLDSVTDNGNSTTNEVTIKNTTYSEFGSGNTDINALLSGSTFGTWIKGRESGHVVIGLRDNDSNDSFAILSGSGNYTTDSTYDKLLARFETNGNITLGGNTNISSGALKIGGTTVIDSSRNITAVNATFTGDLTVSGTTTFIDTTNLNIGDAVITLNADITGTTAPTEDAGIEVKRGSSANVSFLWDETNDRWTLGTEDLVASNFIGSLTGAASLNVLKAGDTMTGDLSFNDNIRAKFGTDNDFRIQHNDTHAFLDNYKGAIFIRNTADDSDIILSSDDGSGSITQYLRVDGSEGSVILYHYGSQKLETTSTGVSITGALSGNISTSSISGGTIDINGTTAINLQYNGSTQLRIDSLGVAYLGTVTFANDGISLTDEDSTTDSFFHANVDYDAGIYTVTSNARYGADYIQVDGKDSRSGNDRVFVISPKDIGDPDPDAMLYLGGDHSITAPNTLVDWHTIEMNALSVQINNAEVATRTWVTSNTDLQDVTDRGATTTNAITTGGLTVNGSADSIIASLDHTAFSGRQAGLPGRFMVGPLGNGYPQIGYNFTTSNSVYTKIANDTAWAIGFGESNRMTFKYAGAGTGTFSWSEFMSIGNTGKIGIGNTSPEADIHIGTNDSTRRIVLHGANSVANSSELIFGDSNIDAPRYAGMGVRYNSSNNNLTIRSFFDGANASDTEIARFDRTTLDSTFQGKVGIGTLTPGVKLDVKDSSSGEFTALHLTNTFDDNNASSNPLVSMWLNAASNNGYLRLYGAPADTASKHRFDIGSTAGGSFITFSTSADEKMRIANDGKVGIGTDAPTDKLQIDAPNSQLRLRDTDDGTFTQFSSSGNLLAIRQNSTTASDHFWMNSSGRVGLGTNSPSNKLHVKSGDNEGIFMEGTGGGHWFNFKSGTSNLWSMGAQSGLMGWYNRTDSSYKMVITDGGSVGIGTTTPARKLQVQGSGYFTGEGNETLLLGRVSGAPTVRSDSSSGGYLIMDSSSNLAALNWYSSQNVVLAQGGGNVLIGSPYVAPNARLHVRDDNAGGIVARMQNDANGAESAIRFQAYTTGGSARYADIALVPDTQTLTIRSPYNSVGGFDVEDGGDVRIRTASGYVNIGALNTTWAHFYTDRGGYYFNQKVIVDGGTIGSYNEDLLLVRADSQSDYIRIADTYIGFYLDGNEDMRLTNAGHLGINQTSPQSKLHITNASGGSGGYLKVTDAGYNGDVRFGMADGIDNDAILGVWTNNNVRAYTNGQERMRIKDNGVVEINPNKNSQRSFRVYYDMEVYNSVLFTDTSYNIQSGIGGTAGALVLYSNGTSERMRITSAGNVGINTTSPQVKLEVRGDILRSSTRLGDSRRYPVGRFNEGEQVFGIDPTWSQNELREFFNSSNVSWNADSTAPGGYAIYINGGVNVGGVYTSGFPYIPVDQDDYFYMEVWIKNAGSGQTHYMGSNEFNENFVSLGGHPGSFGYWVMSNTNPGSSWIKVSGYIGGFSASTVGTFENGTKYWTPMALFNYGAGSGTRACYISGWKVYRVTQHGRRKFTGAVGVLGGSYSAGVDSVSDAGLVVRQGQKIYSLANSDQYLRNLIEHTSANNIVIGQTGTSLIGDIWLQTGSSGNIRFYTDGGETMRLASDAKLHVENDIIAFSTTVSDARLKDNVVTIDNPLDKVKALRGVEYVWNKGGREGQKDLGFIAQEVEQVIPEIVRENEMPLLDNSGEKYKTVDYEKMVAVLVEAIKEQQKQIDELKARLDA